MSFDIFSSSLAASECEQYSTLYALQAMKVLNRSEDMKNARNTSSKTVCGFQDCCSANQSSKIIL